MSYIPESWLEVVCAAECSSAGRPQHREYPWRPAHFIGGLSDISVAPSFSWLSSFSSLFFRMGKPLCSFSETFRKGPGPPPLLVWASLCFAPLQPGSSLSFPLCCCSCSELLWLSLFRINLQLIILF